MTAEEEFEFRGCRTSDVDAVLAFWTRSGAVPRPTDDVAGLQARLSHSDRLFMLALADGQVVGTLMGGWDGWRGNMYRLVVDTERRRQGLARQLVVHVEAEMGRLGVRRVTSLVLVEETGAEELWSALGYERDDAAVRYAKNLSEAADAG